MANTLKRYSPRDVSFTWGVIDLTEDVASGGFITIGRTGPLWTFERGIDGESCRVKSNDLSGVATVTLRRGSNVNRQLTQAAASDEIFGVTVLPLALWDNNGDTRHFSTLAYIEGYPVDVYSDSEPAISWRFQCPQLFMFFGGFDPA